MDQITETQLEENRKWIQGKLKYNGFDWTYRSDDFGVAFTCGYIEDLITTQSLEKLKDIINSEIEYHKKQLGKKNI